MPGKSPKRKSRSPKRKSKSPKYKSKSKQNARKNIDRAVKEISKLYGRNLKLNKSVDTYLLKKNKSYYLVVDLIDVSARIAIDECKRNIITMRDLQKAKTVDSRLEKNF